MRALGGGEAATPFGAGRAASFVRQGGGRAGVPPYLPARCTSRYTDASVHARRHARSRLARRRHRHRPVTGPGVHDLRVFVLPQHSARQRRRNAFGAGISPSLIQSWNDANNDNVFADSIFGPGVRELRVPQHSARQRQHDAFGAGISPSLIQSWNDTHNDKLFADSIF